MWGVTKCNIVRGEHAHFPSKDLHQNMKVLHHFIYGRLVLTLHTMEVIKERAMGSRRASRSMSSGGSIQISVMPSDKAQVESHTLHY